MKMINNMRMNKLAFTRRFTFAVLSLLITANLWGQAALSGSGTENDPYQITSVADWNKFAAAVNGGYDYSGEYIQLEADVPSEEEIYEGTPALTTMVGVWDATEGNRKPFKGTFRGNGKTIIVSYTSDGNYTAPFRCTNGATITNDFTIVGNIDATKGYAAGVVGRNYGKKTKINSNVTVSVNITGGGTYCGGIAVDATKLEVSSCTYNGKIVAGDYSAGFCATGGSDTKFNKCIFAPEKESSITGEHTENFMNGSYGYSSNFYYTYFETPVVSSSTQGTCIYESYDDIPDDGKFRQRISLAGQKYYYVEGTVAISGLASKYYQNNAQNGGITYEVKFNLPGDDPAVLDAECYIADVLDDSYTPVDVGTIAPGTYTLRITGKKYYCSGTLTSESFTIVETLFPNGTGTEADPYQIHDITDWKTFAKAVNEGHSFLGEYLKLTDNIIVTVKNIGTDTIVGTMTSNGVEDKWFSGTFDGDWHTITFNVGAPGKAITPEHNNSPSAPFRVIDGATIKNLTVDGTIYSTKKYNSGFVGFAYNTQTSNVNNIINCTSSIKFYGTSINNTGASGDRVYDCSMGGFVAENKSGNIYFNNCIFDGEINKGGQSSANRGAGFVSYNNGSKLYFTNCTMAGTIGLDKAGTFYRANGAKHEYSNCYYATRPTNQDQEQINANCKEAYTDATIGGLSNEIYKKYVINSTNYYIPSAVITGVATIYSYIAGHPVEITPVVKYYGKTLTRGTDYIIKINGTEFPTADTPTLSDDDEYTFTIEGIGNYGGSYSKTIHVLSYNEWTNVKTTMANDSGGDRTIPLPDDITAAVNDATHTALVVKGTVTLNLNGHTINRSLVHVNENHEIVEDYGPDYNGTGLVIIVESGATLTINGPGTITGGFHKGDATYIDGGGIYNKGTLVLNNVTVKGNKVIKRTDGTDQQNLYSGRGGGIYSESGSSFTMTKGSVIDNEAKGGGGGAFVDGASTCNISNADIILNISEDKGGGLRLAPGNSTTYYISGCDFEANSVTDQNQSLGGGIYMDGESNSTSRVNLNTCSFMDNTAYLKGGAVFSKRGVIYATNCTMMNNMTTDQDFVVSGNSYGGSIYLQASGNDVSTYTMDGGIINGCRAETLGGAVYVAPNAIFNVLGNVQIQNCYVPSADYPNVSNNTYLAGPAVIHVVGPLGPDAKICVANDSVTGTFMEVDPSLSPAVIADIKANLTKYFTLDNTDYNMVYDGSNFVVYAPYPWTDSETWSTPAVATANNLSDGGLPTASSAITLKRAVKIPRGCEAIANSISFEDAGELIIEDGGQLLYNTSIEAKIVKDIVKAPTYESGWYTISSSVHDENSTTESLDNVENLKNEFYDLFAYDEPTHYWINCKYAENTEFKAFTKGRGYIYRRSNNQKIKFAGETNVGSINYNVTYTSDAGTLKGFNLIGNPYTHNITLKYTTLKNSSDEALPAESQLTGYYVLNGAGGWGTKLGADYNIAPAQGFLVQVPSTAAKVNFQQTAKIDRANNDFMRFAISNDEYEDVTYALFAKGLGLTKIGHRNPDIPMVYINQNEQDYAIATMGDDTKSFNLNFEANTTGRYTLSLKTEGEFNYVHLIDKIAEEEIDLLADGEYSFIGSPADMADRFVVRLAYLPDYSDEDNDNFVYQSGNEVLVSGEGTLQVFDVMGRLVMQKQVNGVETWSAASVQTGVYILRMNDKTQKIIIK